MKSSISSQEDPVETLKEFLRYDLQQDPEAFSISVDSDHGEIVFVKGTVSSEQHQQRLSDFLLNVLKLDEFDIRVNETLSSLEPDVAGTELDGRSSGRSQVINWNSGEKKPPKAILGSRSHLRGTTEST